MRYKVLLTDRAESDIDSALLWFRKQRASDAGKRWFNLLTERIQTLELHPDRCPVAAESEYAGAEIRLLRSRRLVRISHQSAIIAGSVHAAIGVLLRGENCSW